MQQLMSEQSLIDGKPEVVEGKGWLRMVGSVSNLSRPNSICEGKNLGTDLC
jgi:hypothetical protein